MTVAYAAPDFTITNGTEGSPITMADVYAYAYANSLMVGGYPVVESPVAGQYLIRANINIGDGVAATYFTSTREMVYFEDGYVFEVKSAATLQTGEIVGDWGINGSYWNVGPPGASWDIIASGSTTAELLWYSFKFDVRTQVETSFHDGDITINKNVWTKYIRSSPSKFTFQNGINTLNIKTLGVDYVWGGCEFYKSPDTMSGYHSHNGRYGFTVRANITLTEPLITNDETQDWSVFGNFTTNIINPRQSGGTPLHVSAGDESNEQYTCNIHVADRDGLPINTATVALSSFGNIVSNDAGANFYKCIVDHTSGVFADDVTAGYWEATTAALAAKAGVTGAAAITGAWVTAVDYVKSAALFSVNTDAAGDIAQQTIDYKRWKGTSEPLQSLAPYTVTITKATYATLVTDDIEPTTIGTTVQPLVEHFELLPYLDPASVEITVEYGEDETGTLIIPTAVAPGGDFESILRAYLAAAATLTAQTGQRIYVDEFPEGFTVQKALLLREASGQDQPDVTATDAFVEFLCVADTLENAKDVYIALHAVLRAANNVTMSLKKVWWNEKTYGPSRLDDEDTNWPTVQCEYRFRVEE